MNNVKQLDNITLPRELFGSMIETSQKWDDFKDKLDDFLSVSDESFITKMRDARQEHISDRVRDFDDFKQEL